MSQPRRLPVIPISTELLEEIQAVLRGHAAGDPTNRAYALVERIERVLNAEPMVSRAWLVACLQELEEQGTLPAPEVERADVWPWSEDERPLVDAIFARTSFMPSVVGDALRYQLRNQFGEWTVRDYDMSALPQRERVLLALRDVARIVRLDHQPVR